MSIAEDGFIRCEHCGEIDEPDAFDVLGADPGKVFCNVCHEQTDNYVQLPCDVTAMTDDEREDRDHE